MTTRKKKQRKRSGWLGRLVQVFKSKWSMQDQIDWLAFELAQKEAAIKDLNNRLEAYKDALVALDRDFRLKGLARQAEINAIVEENPSMDRR